jgi:hypothetical protein
MYSGPVFAVTEVDGVRIVSPDVCDFIQKVPGTCNIISRFCFLNSLQFHLYPYFVLGQPRLQLFFTTLGKVSPEGHPKQTKAFARYGPSSQLQLTNASTLLGRNGKQLGSDGF